jgi:hypothetical protein
LKRWKKYWFTLSVDGHLRYFNTPSDQVAKNTIFMPQEVIDIKTGLDVETKPPEGKQGRELIKIVTRNQPWILCGEDVDDVL